MQRREFRKPESPTARLPIDAKRFTKQWPRPRPTISYSSRVKVTKIIRSSGARFFIWTLRKLHAKHSLKKDRLNRGTANGSMRSQHSTGRSGLLLGTLLVILGTASLFLTHNTPASVSQDRNRSSSSY